MQSNSLKRNSRAKIFDESPGKQGRAKKQTISSFPAVQSHEGSEEGFVVLKSLLQMKYISQHDYHYNINVHRRSCLYSVNHSITLQNNVILQILQPEEDQLRYTRFIQGWYLNLEVEGWFLG